MSGPLYEQIAAELRERIESGREGYRPGQRMPGYRELTEELGTTRATLGEALRILEAEGLVQPRLRAGLTVRERSGRRRVTRHNLISHTPEGGYRFPGAADGERWVAHGKPRASWESLPPEIAVVFDLEPGTEAVRRRRVMSPEGEEPWDLIDTWVPPYAVEDAPQTAEPDTGRGGVLRRLEEAGHGPLTWDEYARASMPSREEARLLQISHQMPVMRILRVGTSARDGRAVECSAYVIPADRIEIHARLQRGPSARWPVTTE